jgi:hypothetical protein
MAITTIIVGTAGTTTTITTMAITIIVATGTTGDCDVADEQACVTAGLFSARHETGEIAARNSGQVNQGSSS